MAIRVLFDANVANAFETLSRSDQARFISAFRFRRYVLYASPEFMEEVLTIAGTAKSSRLQGRGQWLSEVFNGRGFRYYGDVVINELAGRPVVFLPAGLQKQQHAVLREIVSGSIPNGLTNLLQASRSRKLSDIQFFRVHQVRFRSQIPGFPGPVHSTTFEEFSAKYWSKFEPGFSEEMLRRRGVTDPVIEAQRILAHPYRYRYFGVLKQIHCGIFYRYFVLNRRIKPGDIYDASQLMYMQDLDLLVTDDSGMDELFELVWGGTRRILSFSDYMSELSNKMNSAMVAKA